MAVAFFDFDGTLLRRESPVICGYPSFRLGMIGLGMAVRLVASYVACKLKLMARTRMYHIAFAVYRGRTTDEIHRYVEALHRDHMRRWMSPAALAAVRAHRERGDRLVIATAAGRFFAEPLARELGFDAVLGTELVFEGDICTGSVDGDILEGDAKLRRAAAYAREAGVPLEECAFYSDHVADVPLLAAVGTAVALGPHAPLARVARERGWKIVAHDDITAPSLL